MSAAAPVRTPARPGPGSMPEALLRALDLTLPDGDGILLSGRTLYVVRNVDNEVAVVRLARDGRRGTVVSPATGAVDLVFLRHA